MPLMTFNPLIARQGQAVAIYITPPTPAERWELWGYTTPNRVPQSEDGWSRIGEVGANGGQIRWDTSQWPYGTLTLTVIGYIGGSPVIHWRSNPSLMQTYSLQAPESNTVPPVAPPPPGTQPAGRTTGSTGGSGLSISPDGIGGVSWEMIALGVAGVVGVLWWMKKGGGS